jgi:hypothetical protein
MLRSTLVVVSCLMLCMFAQPSRAQDKIEVFGGYSYARAPIANVTVIVLVDTCPAVCPSSLANGGANGWEASGVIKTNRWFGVGADFGGYHVSAPAFGGNAHLQTYLFGPQISLPWKISPFAHALVGTARETTSAGNTNAFSSAIGGGLDLKLYHFVSLRAIQTDYMTMRFGGSTQNEFRASTGVVLRF